jgi:glyoxylase-like metal-dependent hydrolase (beta-lactamase superfamily II)
VTAADQGERSRAVVTDLGGGVHRVTLPLPWALDHVHCYAIADDDGWTIVDAGLGTPGTLRRWEDALRELGDPAVRRVVVTHYHPDHLGGSAQLVRLVGAGEVVQGRADQQLTYDVWGPGVVPGAFEAYLLHHGMPAEDAARSAGDEGDTPVHPAEPTRLVDEGDIVEIAGEPFGVLLMPGHADGHIVLYGERSGRFFGGDVLLHEITPNVGRWEDTAPDPLGRYLETLRRIERLAPRVVYPGHRAVIEDPAARAREIVEHHGERLDVHLEALRLGARSAFDVGKHVWGGRLGFHEQRFALVEAISHLERLVAEGRAVEVEPARWAPA